MSKMSSLEMTTPLHVRPSTTTMTVTVWATQTSVATIWALFTKTVWLKNTPLVAD
eukprot:COSAG05_NODE_559_length_8689_cov_212.699418_3_plen_55_part_00